MSLVEAVDGQCHFYLKKKHRYCRFQPKEGQKYCPEHSCIMGVHGIRKRIPCPLNPSHNCYQDELDKHVKKCNVTKVQKATQEAIYYVHGINKGTVSEQTAETLQEDKKVCVKDLTSAELAAMIARVDKLYEEHVEVVEEAVYEHPCLREEFCRFEEDLSQALGEQAALRKELLQQASLVGQLDHIGLLSDGHCFVEMGAGKGKLSHWIQKASKDCTNNSFLLIERSSVRYKMDSFHKQAGAESMFKRIKIDIEDLCLGCAELGNSTHSVVVVGKHLCGGATDMGIRCAVETLGIQRPSLNCLSVLPHSIDQSLPILINSEQQNPIDQQHKSVPEKVSLQHFDTSETVAHIVSSFVPCDKSPQVNVSSAVGTEISENNSTTNDKLIGKHEDSAANKDIKDTSRKVNEPTDLEHEMEPPAKAQKLADNESRQKLPKGIMIALCCHHYCTWDSYLGQEFMQSCGVTSQEFDLLTRLSSWATCARVTAKSSKNIRKSHESESGQTQSAELGNTKTVLGGSEEIESVLAGRQVEEHGTDDLINSESSKHLREQLSVSEREAIGRKCKRLIDTGRLHYLRAKGMNCCLRKYISEELTPENVVLVAYLPDL